MTFILHGASNVLVLKKIDDEGYIFKSSSSNITLSTIIAFGLRFVPYVNIGIATLTMALTLLIVSKNDVWNDFIEKYRNIPSRVIKKFEQDNLPTKVIKDTLKLDGAEGFEKASELIKSQLVSTGLVRDDNTLPTWLDTPKFTENDYNKARVMIAAEQMLYEVECNVTLNSKQKEKLLNLFKCAYLSEFKKPEIEYSDQEYIVEEEPIMVAIGDNNNLVEVEKELEDTLETNAFYKKIRKIVK